MRINIVGAGRAVAGGEVGEEGAGERGGYLIIGLYDLLVGNAIKNI